MLKFPVTGASQQIYDFQTLYLSQKFIIPKSLMVFAVLLFTIFWINKLPSFCAVSNETIMVNLNKWLVKQIYFLHYISLVNIKNKGIKEIPVITKDKQCLDFTQILLDCSTRNIRRIEWWICVLILGLLSYTYTLASGLILSSSGNLCSKSWLALSFPIFIIS